MFSHNKDLTALVIPEKPQALSGIQASLRRGAGALTIAAVAMAFAPGAAQADNECGLQTLPGTAETVTCNPGDYAGGITYSSLGDLTVEVPDDTVDLTVNADGVNVTGNLADNVSWDSSAFVSGDIVGTGGAVLDYSSGSGAIGIETGGDVRANGSATHAIRAVSGSGDVTIQTNEGGRIFGGDYGIQAETGGAGTLDIIVGDDVIIPFSSATNVAAIDATTGTGLLTIDLVSKSSPDGSSFEGVSGGSGIGIRTDAGGDALINIAAGRRVSASASGGGIAMDLTAAGQTTVNNVGVIATGSGVAIQAAGGRLVLNNDNEILGALDFSGLAGGYTFNNNAGAEWDPSSVSGQVANLGAGELNNAGTISLNRGDYISAPGTTFAGTGDSVIEMRILFLDGRGQSDCASPTIAACLDLTGGTTAGQTAIRIETQKFVDFVLEPSGGLDIKPLLKAIDRPLNPGVVLVDVSGGTSSADHFVLDPGSVTRVARNTTGTGSADFEDVPIYAEDEKYGAVLKTGGLFDYALLYNPDTQQHILGSVPQREAVEYIAIVQEALSIWHTTSDTIAGWQADLRDDGERGAWIRVVSEQTERDASPTMTTHGNTFTYDSDYDLDTKALIGGYDLSADENHVLGLHLGLVAARQEYDGSSSRNETRGATFGAYGGWWLDSGLTLDGTVNVNVLSVKHSPDRDLEKSNSTIESLGARVEAGWRLPLGEAFYVQPLATAAYVNSNIEGQDLRFNDAEYENSQSSRTALGVRLGGGMDLANDRLSRVDYWLTARAWEEYAGDDVELRYEVASGDDLVIEDDISGTFEEVGLGVSLTSPDGSLKVFLSGNGKFGDETDSHNITIGARLNW